MLYSQMQNDITRQQVVAYPNPNSNFRDSTDGVVRTAPPYPFTENKMAFCEEVTVLLGRKISCSLRPKTDVMFFFSL